MSEGGRTSQTDGAWLPGVQANWPTGGGRVVVVEVEVVVVDVEEVVEEVVEVELEVVLLVVVGTVVVAVVVVVVVVDVVLIAVVVLVDTTLLVAAGDSAVREGELLDASHALATRTTVIGTSLVSRSATRDATSAVCQRPAASTGDRRDVAVLLGVVHRHHQHRPDEGTDNRRGGRPW